MVRPDLKQRYDLTLQRARKTPMNQGAIDAFWQAADVFAGSTDQGELELRHEAIASAAATLRQLHDLPGAEALYARMATLAEAEAGPRSFNAGIGWYFVGILRNQRDESAAAIEPFQKALAVFTSSPAWKNEARTTATSLGLAMLREQRWDEVTSLLRRHAGQGAEDETQAALLHNLTIAGARSNLRELMVPIGELAVALRKKLNGPNHPLLADTMLALAYAQVEAGEQEKAAITIREAAKIVLDGAGEQHPFFADALLVEGRRLARLGDGPAAEGLARRALQLLEPAGLDEAALAQRRRDAAAITTLWRPASFTGAPLRLWHARLQHTLRRYQGATLDFAGSGELPLEWLFFGPTEVDENSPAGLTLMRCAIAEENRRLSAREPGDPNLLDLTGAEVSLPLDEAVLELPFQKLWQSRVWETSVGWSLVDPRNPVPLTPAEFARALTAYLASHGTTEGVEQALSVFGLDPLLAQQAREHPAQVLREVLEARSG